MSVTRPEEIDTRQRITQRTVTVDRPQEHEAEPQEQQASEVEAPASIIRRTVSVSRP